MHMFHKNKLFQNRFFIFGFLFTLTAMLVFLLFSKNVFSFHLPITWDENAEEDIAGYKIFYRKQGQSYNYNVPAWVGSGISCIIYDLDDKTTYYFVARAYNTLGIESEDSEELKVEFIDGEVKINSYPDPGSYTGGGCFITTGDSDL